MRLELKDVPGTLLRALKPISEHGGNIISVLHLRGNGDMVPVEIIFGIGDESMLNLINDALEERNIHVIKIDVDGRKYYEKKTHRFIFIGHVIDTDIRDTIDRMNEMGVVSDLEVVMPDPNEKSSVLMVVDVDREKNEELMGVVDEVCREKDLLLIKSLD